jgi:oligopeptidase A
MPVDSLNNPLLDTEALPAFGSIRPEHVEPAVDALLADNRAAIAALLENPAPRSWESLVAPLEECHDRLSRAWSPVAHLHAVMDSEPLRRAYNACLPKLTDYWTELGQNEPLYHAWLEIAEGPEYARLDPAQRKVIDHALRDFRLSGVALQGAARARFREIQSRLSQLQTRFEENLLDATQAFSRHVTDPARLAGLPDSALALARQTAGQRGLDGWLITLEYPSYMPVMRYARDRELRHELYEAYVTRASDQGPEAGKWDNGATMSEILALRAERARLLGYAGYAHLSLATKMADSPEEVLSFLRDLVRRVRPIAAAELEELRRFAASEIGKSELEPWDLAYYSEKLRSHSFGFSQEDLRPYFPAPQVLSGMFAIVERLYGIHVHERHGVETWHPDVRFFEIFDEGDESRGSFYLDLYARPHKRGGAWMDDCIVRRLRSGSVQLPVAYLVCNFTPPIGDAPALLTHDEVMTLFHEFGHGLHHLLTRVDYAPVSGINGVPWDAVELPSQFMENWSWERESLDLLARHYESGAALPEVLFECMTEARNFQNGMHILRQLEFGLFDFRLHVEGRGTGSAADIQALLDDVRREAAVIVPPAFNRFQHSFSHIFAGGYAAGYYSYLWAEVLAADAFSMFEETGIFNRETGRRFMHTILEQGGARDPMELFREFRGRPPGIDALLRHAGIHAVELESAT